MVATATNFTKKPLHRDFDAFLAAPRFEDEFLDFIHRNRVGNFYGEDESKKAVTKLLSDRRQRALLGFLDDIMASLTTVDRGGEKEPITIQSQLKAAKKMEDLYDFLFGLGYLEPRYALKLGGKDISQLSPREKGALLLVFHLLLDPESIPIIIDQPEQNLDNESVVKLLVDCIRQARARRQVIIVTHNPDLAGQRHTPPSVRFFGPRVYLAPMVVLISTLLHGATVARMARISQLFGVDRRTVARWRLWWRTTFAQIRFWSVARAASCRRSIPTACPSRCWSASRVAIPTGL